jgi:hypothetical protein
MKHLFYILFLLSGCAVVVHPSGGPKDEEAPEVLHTLPDSQATNFQEKNIKIQFNEFIELKDPNGILFSPPLKEKPEITVNGKTLLIKPKKKLNSNSTYRLQLINAISDITEKNTLDNFEIVFSTGDEIDSAKISGYVLDNIQREAAENYVVALFHTDYHVDDSLIFPLYLTKTNKEGYFKIEGIKEGKYAIYAFEDINNNLKCETGEKAAFHTEPVNTSDTTDIKLYASTNKIASAFKIIPGYASSSMEHSFYVHNATKKEMLLVPDPPRNDKSKLPYFYNKKDSLHIFDPYAEKEQHYFIYLNQEIEDTIQISYKKNAPEPLLKLSKSVLEPFDTIILESRIPYKEINPEKITLWKDSIQIPCNLTKKHPFKAQIIFNRNAKSNYALILSDSSVTDIFEKVLPKDTLKFSTVDDKNYGSINIKWQNNEKIPYVIELMKDKSKEPDFSMVSSKDSASFFMIPAGDYYLRIYPDTGNHPSEIVLFREQITPVFYYTEKIKLRGGWTISDIFINKREENTVDK